MQKLLTLIAFLAINFTLFSQAPQRLSYQAVIRNSSGGLVTSHAVGIKISILQGSPTGTAVYIETHTTTTNANGLATIEIGGGSVVSGAFATINWASGTYYLKTETDPAGGSSYSIIGTSQLLSVPYALLSKTSGELKLPFSGSADYDGFPFSITNPKGAIYGKSTIVTGDYTGIQGETAAPKGKGVYGLATSKTDINYGVYGETLSPYGYGIYGKVNSPVGAPSYGVYGESISILGIGVKGVGGRMGVSGSAESGVGVSGVSTLITGDGIGVWALTNASSGTGMRAIANSATGTNYGIYSTTASSSGYSGYFSGGKFYVNGRIGIGTTSPSAGFHLKGAGFPESFMFLEANTGQDAGFRLYEGATAKWHIFNNSAAGGLLIYNSSVKTAIFCDQATANVGIGRTDPGFDLDVYGNIRATGSVYYGSSPAVMYNKPDYVFGGSYDFMKTEEVEEFLEKEKHLPWITSAEKEKKDNGDVIDMTRMAFETVESVENMQLQIIEQNKLIRKIQAENDRLKSENADITLRLEKLEAIISK